MDVVDAYARLGSYRAAGEVCGVDPKTVKRKVLAHQSGVLDEERAERAVVPRNTDPVRQVVLDALRETGGRGEAKRLLPVARTAGYVGSDREPTRPTSTASDNFAAGWSLPTTSTQWPTPARSSTC